MFLVVNQRGGTTYYVFLREDPRPQGVAAVEGVSLNRNPGVPRWDDDPPRPATRLGRSPDDPKAYRVFRTARDLRDAGYSPLAGTVVAVARWSDYLKACEELP